MRQATDEREQQFSAWQRRLTYQPKLKQPKKEVLARQRELRDAVDRGAAAFAAYLREQLALQSDALIEAPALPRPLDASEFRDPPFELEREIYDSWHHLVTPVRAAQPLFWTLCHIAWIENGLLVEPLHAALLGKLASGEPEGTSEAATRNLLRRMGGLPHVRGKVSVLSDCPISRAWWRGRLAASSAAVSNGLLDVETVHRILHASNDAWARLVGDSVRRVTAINSARTRAAVLYQYRTAGRGAGRLDPQEMQRTVRLLARQGPPLIFDALDWSELLQMAEAAAREARAEPGGTAV